MPLVYRLVYNFDPHAPGRTLDHSLGMLDVASVQVVLLLPTNVLNLSAGHFADLIAIRNTSALRNSGGNLEQRRGWRALRYEFECAVGKPKQSPGSVYPRSHEFAR